MLNNLFKVGWKLKKWWHHLLYDDIINFLLTRKCQKTRKIEVLILNEKISLSSEQVEILEWNFQERHDLILKSHKKTRLHPLSRVYKFGASYNYCKNLKWKNLSKIFDFSILGTGQSFCLSFCLNIKLQQLSKFEVRECFARYPSFLQKLRKFFYFSSKIISWPLSFCLS